MKEFPIDTPYEEPERGFYSNRQMETRSDKVFRIVGYGLADLPLLIALLIVFGLSWQFAGFLGLWAITCLIKLAIYRF